MEETASQVTRPVTCSWVTFLWRVYRRLQLISPTVIGPSSCKQKNTSLFKPPSSLEFDFCDILKRKKAIEYKMYFDQHCQVACSLRASSPGRSGGGAGKGRRACNFATNSTSNSPVAPSRLSCHISANQREAETSANVNKR